MPRPAEGGYEETVDEFNSELEEQMLAMKKKQKSQLLQSNVTPEEVERRLQLHLLRASVENEFSNGTISPEKILCSPERIQLFGGS